MVADQAAKRTKGEIAASVGKATKGAPAFGVRGACSRFLEEQRGRGRCGSAGKPDALQTLRANARRGSMNRAPAFGVRGACCRFLGDSRGRGRCQSAGKPDALQTLRANAGRGSMNRAPAFGVRGACSRFVEELPRA